VVRVPSRGRNFYKAKQQSPPEVHFVLQYIYIAERQKWTCVIFWDLVSKCGAVGQESDKDCCILTTMS
jgi:hypothetical protein